MSSEIPDHDVGLHLMCEETGIKILIFESTAPLVFPKGTIFHVESSVAENPRVVIHTRQILMSKIG